MLSSAIRLFVVSQGWRTANYVHEPGRGPIGGPLDRFATECETIAAADSAFAASFGTRFHRDRGPDVPPGPNRDSSPSPSTRGGRKAPRANKRPRSGNAPSRQSSRRLGQPAGPGLA
ncbi:hypothetical protein ABVK25_006446 [Lepraria finkii]|uniref:Uncharacterized protein n=1 Tax=Lepraria finkii TaxID=1340010 RepID=A0ABR4B5I8_9LECA